MRWILAFVALLAPVTTAVAAKQDYRRHLFKQPVEMRVDPTRVAVRGGAETIAGFRQQKDSFQLPLDGWRLIHAERAKTGAADVRAAVDAIASTKQVEFVSPVFLDDRGDPMIVTQDILVGFVKSVPAARAREIASRYGDILDNGLRANPSGFKVRSRSVNGNDVLRDANELALLPEVEFAEPDMIVSARTGLIPTDPAFSQSWALRNIGQSGGLFGFDMGATSAWDTTTGDSTVIVVVLDDGVQSTHPDLAGRVVTPGYDATGQGGQGEPVYECDRHGTAVAGCIVAKMNNGQGSVGIAPNARIISARIGVKTTASAPCSGNFWSQFSWVADALYWAQGQGARVSNASFYGGDESAAINTAYAATYEQGMIHFACTGNDASSTVGYPARIGVVNGVGALNRFGARSGLSNWGTGLDFSAPGESIYSTDLVGANGYSSTNFTIVNGTSFASPLAAGAAALILSVQPGLMPAQVESIMQATSQDLGEPGFETDFGWGLVRADAAIRAVNGECPPMWDQGFGSSRPSARVGYSMAYDASRREFVLHGGDAGAGPLADTWIWNGASWRMASTSGPSARANAVAVFDSVRNRVILFGGRSGSAYLDDTWEWNGSAWAQVATTGAPPPRGTAGMAFDSGRGRAVLFGGFGPSGHLGDLWEYNGTSWTERSTPPVGAREWPGLAYDSVRTVLVLTGGASASGSALSDTWEWNAASDVWLLRDSGANGPPSRANKNLAFDPQRGVTILFSGYAGSNIFRADHWEWNGSSWTQRLVAIPSARYGHTLAYDSFRGRVATFGGELASGGLTDSTWEFDGLKWIPMGGTAPSPRFGASVIYAPELGGAVMFGGATALNGSGAPTRTDEMWVRSPSGWGRLDATGPSSRAYASIGSIPDFGLVMFGGMVGTGQPTSEFWRFADGAWTLLNPSAPPAPAYGAASCVFTSSGRFVVFGGRTGGSLSNILGVIRPSTAQGWLQYGGGTAPSARENAMMAYDPVRDEAILAGGRSPSGFEFDDVWRLRFVSGQPEWTPMNSLGILNAWSGGSMFWDPGRERILLYGKQQFGFEPGAAVLPTVFEWTGSMFVPISQAPTPSLRRFAAFAPTSASGDIRMSGGLLASGAATILSDDWSFNGQPIPGFPAGPDGGGSFPRGSTVTLTLPIIAGDPDFLRWKRDGVPIFDGATPAGSIVSGSGTGTLVITNVKPSDGGWYRISGSNACGVGESMDAFVEVTVNCPADLSGDGLVNGNDLAQVLAAWGTGLGDVNGDGTTSGDDLAMVLAAWGACS